MSARKDPIVSSPIHGVDSSSGKDDIPLHANNKVDGGFFDRLSSYWAFYTSFAIPGLGMFSEAYIIFSAGQVKPFQKTMYPTCYSTYSACDKNTVEHVSDYIQICGIIAGMLLWGFLADFTGRKWGSRIVAGIMLTGCIMLVFTPYAATPSAYFTYFITAQTWYGFGVGGEYPLASASAAERAESNPELQKFRGQQVVLTFSNQGLGNLTNCVVILIAMAIFGQTKSLDVAGSKNVLLLSYGVGCFMCLVMVAYRALYLEESEMFNKAKSNESSQEKGAWKKQLFAMRYYWPRALVASVAWICNDFAFYGNKLQQGRFIAFLYPGTSTFYQQQWTVLNSFIGLLGYYAAAVVIDKPWYGRRLCQNIGFGAMFIFYIAIYADYDNMNSVANAPTGMHAFQALYYLSSFFNQFGPNCTTWLVAGEIFPTPIRATNHGLAAAMGKFGAIIASLWISNIVSAQPIFLISAIFGLIGAFFTYLFLPDTTGLDLKELDILHTHVLNNTFEQYTGEAINPRHLSPFELYVFNWSKNYEPDLPHRDTEMILSRKGATIDI